MKANQRFLPFPRRLRVRIRRKAPSGPSNLWRFLEMARPYRGLIAALVLIGVVRFALQLATPWGVRVLLDGALKNTEGLTVAVRDARPHQVYSLTLVLTVALVMRCLYLYGEPMLTGKLGNRLIFDLRRRLYTHIQRLSLSFFDRRRAGSIGCCVIELRRREVGRLPVVDRANPRRLLGILRRADVVGAYGRAAPE